MKLEHDRVTLLLGDCLNLMDTIPDGSVDMILADIPFGTTACKWDVIIPFAPMWSQLKRVTKPNGAIVLMAQTPFDKALGASNLPMLKYEWIWEKSAATGHLNAKKMPMKAHENVLVFYDRLPMYNPIKTYGHARKTSKADRGNLQSEIHGKQKGVTAYDSTERYPRSVLKFASDKQTCNLHPTQKPVALCEYLIRTYTQEDEVILDFTMGSGSTGVAAYRLGRKFIGIELEDSYFNAASKRIFDEVFGK